MLDDRFLDGLGQVFPQVPPVRDVNRLRGAEPSGLGVCGGAVVDRPGRLLHEGHQPAVARRPPGARLELPDRRRPGTPAGAEQALADNYPDAVRDTATHLPGSKAVPAGHRRSPRAPPGTQSGAFPMPGWVLPASENCPRSASASSAPRAMRGFRCSRPGVRARSSASVRSIMPVRRRFPVGRSARSFGLVEGGGPPADSSSSTLRRPCRHPFPAADAFAVLSRRVTGRAGG